MKRQMVFSFVICLLAACAGRQEITMQFDDPQLHAAYQQWLAIDVANLTPKQREHVAELDEVNLSKLTEQDRRFIGYFPWIDPANLTVRDKVFLGDRADELSAAMMMADKFG